MAADAARVLVFLVLPLGRFDSTSGGHRGVPAFDESGPFRDGPGYATMRNNVIHFIFYEWAQHCIASHILAMQRRLGLLLGTKVPEVSPQLQRSNK